MDYDGLTREYWDNQRQRVEEVRARINGRSQAAPGRIVPEDESLAIGEGRRLQMAVMFLDISGFSQRPSETPAEQDMLLRVLNLFFSEMIRVAEEYGGTVEKNTGDGLMAYFEDNAGNPPETGTKRAVACALTMMAANQHLIRPILAATPVPEIIYRVSIDYGPVTIARLGAPRRFNANVAIGATANFASKMLAKADPGDIVLGAAARDQLPMAWQLRYTQLATLDTGWFFRADGSPYALYKYSGRWKTLT
jgi:class 3 adenylate cyclase